MKHARTLSLGLLAIAALGLLLHFGSRRTNAGAASPVAAAGGRPQTETPTLVSDFVQAEPTDEPIQATREVAGLRRGRFVDFHTGDPIPGAVFHVRYAKDVERADDEGAFALPAQAGRIDFEAGAEGYCVVHGALTLEPGDRDAVELPLVRASPVEGLVLDERGVPVSRPYVYTISPSGAPPTSAAPSDFPPGWSLHPEGLGGLIGEEDGTFRLAGLVPGASGYQLKVSAGGHRQRELRLDVAAVGPTHVRVVLEREARRIRGSIRGRAYLNDTLVPADAFFAVAGDTFHGDWDEEEQAFLFDSVPVGTGRLYAVPAHWSIVDDVYRAVPWLSGGEIHVTVQEGLETEVDAYLEIPMGRISGRVLDAAGVGQAGRHVYAVSSRLQIRSASDLEGRFLLEVPVTGEHYTVQAGFELVAPRREDVAPGTAGLVLRDEEFATFTLSAIDVDTGADVSIVIVGIRPPGSEGDWHHAPGPAYRAPPGPLEVRVISRDHEKTRVTVHVQPGDANHFQVEVRRR